MRTEICSAFSQIETSRLRLESHCMILMMMMTMMTISLEQE